MTAISPSFAPALRRIVPPAVLSVCAAVLGGPLVAQQTGPSRAPQVEQAAVSSTAGGRRVASGRAGQLNVEPPRITGPESDITVDGVIDEPVWDRAVLLTGFSQYQPSDGQPADDSTQVLVWYSPTAMYFGVRAFERHGAVRATLSSRDKIGADDAVHILLDTFNDRRRAMDFGVNPFGVQSDGNLVEGLQARSESRNRSSGASRDTVDLSADFVYQSKGRLTDYGYEVELRIPFKSLPYQSVATQTWGLNVIREVQHSAYEDTWTPATRSNASFLAQSGTLAGLTGLSRGLVLDAVPEITSKVNGAQAALPATGWNYDAARPKLGGSMRWGITNNLTLSGTANPDFSQVEADAQQVQSDPRRATQYAEKRPFFLEGIDQFQVPNSLIYTRRVVQPVGALKLAGKVGNTSIGVLSAADTKLQSVLANTNPIYNMVRVRHDIGKQSNIGLAYTDRVESGDYNRMGSLDMRFVVKRSYTFRSQVAGSFTRTGNITNFGPMWDVAIERSGRQLNTRYQFTGFSPKFQARGGFIGRTNSANLVFSHRFTWYGKPKSIIESFTWTFPLSDTWNYRRMVEGYGGDLKNDNSWTLALRGGWRLSFAYFLETFKYDPDLFATYAIERHQSNGVVDTIPFVGTDRLTNHDLGWSVQTPQYKKVDAFVSIFTGWDENFSEWSRAWYWNMTYTVNFRPSNKFRVSGNLVRREYQRLRTRIKVLTRSVPYVKTEYQVSRAIFFRMVAQYDIQWRDSLHDESRTNQPLLIRNSRGVYQRALITRSNDLRVDWLFSYQPNPGTVLFLGYGSSLTETLPLHFDDIRRVSDGFFVKFSYLFRV